MACDDGSRRGLLIDWGGVLTSDVFASFTAFCELEGLEPDALVRTFRDDHECRELLFGLETGAVAQEQFEPRLAAPLGVSAPGLIDRLFAGARPDEQMIEAVRARSRRGDPRPGSSRTHGERRATRGTCWRSCSTRS